MTGVSAEQQARDLLERLDVEGAQNYSAGEIVELANLIADSHPARVLHRLEVSLSLQFTDAVRAGDEGRRDSLLADIEILGKAREIARREGAR